MSETTLDEMHRLARELRIESDRLREKLDIVLRMRPVPHDLVSGLQAESDDVLDKLTMFVVLAEGELEHLRREVPGKETNDLICTLERARALLDEVRP